MNDYFAALASVIAKQELEIHRLRAELQAAQEPPKRAPRKAGPAT